MDNTKTDLLQTIKDPDKKGYYLTKTTELKWGVAYWDGVKFWDDVHQDGNLSFGIKREFISQWYALPEDWVLSRERMPEHDGFYYVYGFMHHECGNVTPFHTIAHCSMNQWVKSDPGEQMTYWKHLLEPPVIL